MIQDWTNLSCLIQLEDPFVLRKALDVTRSQLWAIQERLDLQGEGGQSRRLKNIKRSNLFKTSIPTIFIHIHHFRRHLEQLADEKQDLKNEIGRLEGEVARLQTLLHKVSITEPNQTPKSNQTTGTTQTRWERVFKRRGERCICWAQRWGNPKARLAKVLRARNTAKKQDTGLCTGAAGWWRVGSRGGRKCAKEEVATSW